MGVGICGVWRSWNNFWFRILSPDGAVGPRRLNCSQRTISDTGLQIAPAGPSGSTILKWNKCYLLSAVPRVPYFGRRERIAPSYSQWNATLDNESTAVILIYNSTMWGDKRIGKEKKGVRRGIWIAKLHTFWVKKRYFVPPYSENYFAPLMHMHRTATRTLSYCANTGNKNTARHYWEAPQCSTTLESNKKTNVIPTVLETTKLFTILRKTHVFIILEMNTMVYRILERNTTFYHDEKEHNILLWKLYRGVLYTG